MMKLRDKILLPIQMLAFFLSGIFLSACHSSTLERHKTRCLEAGFIEGSKEMEKCTHDLLKADNKKGARQSYNSAQDRTQKHFERAQIQWKKRELQQRKRAE